MIESEIERKFVRMVRQGGGRVYKFVSPGNVGVPDRIVVLPGGSVWFVELKTDTGRLMPQQKLQLKALESLGANVFVLRGLEGLEKFREVMSPCNINRTHTRNGRMSGS